MINTMQIGERLPGENQRDYARRIIRANIVSLALEPGQMISENELSQELGVSRTPVREALGELAAIQVIQVMPQRGIRVGLIDYDMIEEARFTRQVLEIGILPKVAERLGEKDRLQMEMNLREQALSEEDSERFLQLDNEFHRQLFLISGMENTYRMMEEMQIHFDRIRKLALSRVRNSRNLEDHQKIWDALLDGNVSLAQNIMKEHLSRIQVERTEIFEMYPHYIRK